MAGLIDFQNEAEVKQYLDNLGIEYSFQCHKEKDPEGCQRLADYLEGVKKNYEATAQVLKMNCEQNEHPESCYKLGAYYTTGKGGLPQCLKTAYSCFLKSCEKGGKKSVDACHNVGLLAHDGRALGGKVDPVVARDYYTRACEGGFTASCFNLSALFIQGAPGLGRDMGLALRYALRACDLGHVWGCANASRMFKLGEGAPGRRQGRGAQEPRQGAPRAAAGGAAGFRGV
ncbi:cytochrome c oxidase assembly factor 7-like, partial [Acipenser oxyrinchus oxyrinchus]